MQIKLIFKTKVLHLATFWKWEFLEFKDGSFSFSSCFLVCNKHKDVLRQLEHIYSLVVEEVKKVNLFIFWKSLLYAILCYVFVHFQNCIWTMFSPQDPSGVYYVICLAWILSGILYDVLIACTVYRGGKNGKSLDLLVFSKYFLNLLKAWQRFLTLGTSDELNSLLKEP